MTHRTAPLSLVLFTLLFASAHTQTISGTLTSNTILDASSSPWEVTGNVSVSNGITLTIEPGCTLYFHDGVGIEINNDGQLLAVGEPQNRITLTRLEDSSDRWDGISFEDTDESNKIGYTDILYGNGGNQIIKVDHSNVVLDNLTWNTDNKTIIEVTHPYLIIQNCTFPSLGSVEAIHGNYLSNDEYFILIGNTFGKPKDYNDVIDFTDCKKPGPILEVYNNTFHGGGDDGLDLDGTDAHIEGNIFMGFHKDHDGASTSNAIATGR